MIYGEYRLSLTTPLHMTEFIHCYSHVRKCKEQISGNESEGRIVGIEYFEYGMDESFTVR